MSNLILLNGKYAPNTILIDKRNFAQMKSIIIEAVSKANLIGFDLETEDSNRHAGLNRAMKTDDEGYKGGNTKLLFDTQRTIVTGFSLYADGDSTAYYVNLAHADVENRLHFWRDGVHEILESKQDSAYWVAHKAPYELTFMDTGWGAEMEYRIRFPLGEKVICTMQQAVSAFNEDTYATDDFMGPGLGNIERLFGAVKMHFAGQQNGDLTKDQEELIYKVTAKESTAEHSYNGYVNSIKYTYGLKKLAKKFLGYEQTTFSEVMNGAAHMGQKTGEEIAGYGADDAWVCLYLYHALLAFMMRENPKVVSTFFTQENPMVQVYSDVWKQGVKINLTKVKQRKEEERVKVAVTLSKMKAAIKFLLPFPEDVHEKLVKYDEKTYGKMLGDKYTTAERYRASVVKWANSANAPDPFTEVYKTKTSLSKQWAAERGLGESSGLSLTYYQVVRCIVLDLCRLSFQLADGKIQSDAEALDKMRQRHIKKGEEATGAKWVEAKGDTPAGFVHAEGTSPLPPEDEIWEAKLVVLDQYKALKATDQSIKLYLAPYENLTDPETGRVYPILSSNLNSRRMALESPNLSQLAKFSAMGYVREFFEPDEEDHVMVSADWSAVELVLTGDESGDKRFAWAYSTIPHQDIHSATAAALLDMSLEEFGALADKKKKRTELGKPANFGYWYSGGLGTVAKELGWSSERMWEFVEKYRSTYPEAEQWRLGVIQTAQEQGRVQLRDHHMRYRLESTPFWQQIMQQKFYAHGTAVGRFGDICIRKIQRRSGNQAVNSLIQGGCATLAKRSVLRMRQIMKDKGYRARFMFPVHDELVYSVHKDEAIAFMNDLRMCMTEHPEIVQNLKLDVAMAVGKNYWAYDPEKNKFGQVELDECSKKLPCIPEERWEKKLTDAERQVVVDWLCAGAV